MVTLGHGLTARNAYMEKIDRDAGTWQVYHNIYPRYSTGD